MNNNTFQVQVVRRGIITLPKELREHNNIEEGDTLTLIELGDGVVIMSPKRSRVPKNGRTPERPLNQC